MPEMNLMTMALLAVIAVKVRRLGCIRVLK